MNFSKLIYQSKVLVKNYINSNDHDLLQGIKKEFNPSKKDCCGFIIKYIYLYQIQKEKSEFPIWYIKKIEEKRNQLELYFQKKIEALVLEAHFNKKIDLNLEKKIIGIYKKNNTTYSNSIIDRLPLHLRLKIYFDLYRAEENLKKHCYLRNKLSNTLAKLGESELAQQLSLFNWALSQEFEGLYFADSHYTKTKIDRYKLESKRIKHLSANKSASSLAEELILYYKQLLTDGYTAENISTLDLVTASFSEYSQLKELVLPIKTYLRTKNEEELSRSLENLKKAFIYEHHEILLIHEENKNSNILRDQLIIYNELLRFFNKEL